MHLREATTAEFRLLFGAPPPDVWDCWVAHDDGGEAVAAGSVVWLWERDAPVRRCWLQLFGTAAASPFVLHRIAKRMVAYAAHIGEHFCWAYSNPTRPADERYLRRLGFVPDPDVTGPYDWPVWRKDLRCDLLN